MCHCGGSPIHRHISSGAETEGAMMRCANTSMAAIPFSIGSIILEIMFLAVLAHFAWKQRANRFVFWGWIVVIAMIGATYFYFDWLQR